MDDGAWRDLVERSGLRVSFCGYCACLCLAGWTLDTTEADEQHERLLVGKERYRAALMAWMAVGAPTGGHPGSLAEWMPD